MWGNSRHLYNKDMIPEPNSLEHPLGHAVPEERVHGLYRDSMGITLKYLGYSMNSREVPELMAAKDKLIERVRRCQSIIGWTKRRIRWWLAKRRSR